FCASPYLFHKFQPRALLLVGQQGSITLAELDKDGIGRLHALRCCHGFERSISGKTGHCFPEYAKQYRGLALWHPENSFSCPATASAQRRWRKSARSSLSSTRASI